MSMFIFIIVSIMLKFVTANNSLITPERRCVPTSVVHGPCHICACTTEGVYHCRSKPCQEDIANITHLKRDDVPELQNPDGCVPGNVYRIDCNLCQCLPQGLICTKMLCLNHKMIKRAQKKTKKTHLRQGKEKKEIKAQIPGPFRKLPKGDCEPGSIYRDSCQKCFCDIKKKATCTDLKNACSTVDMHVHHLEDIRPRFSPSEIAALPMLKNRTQKCKPGKAYRVSCNSCVCLKTFNLACDQLMCLSLDETHRINAMELSGKQCTPKTGHESQNCVKCTCVDNKQQCQEITGCVSEYDKKRVPVENGAVVVPFDHEKENCIPGMVYKQNCNNCVCQPDITLRCTQKTCLNFSLFRGLEKQRLYLLKHGL